MAERVLVLRPDDAALHHGRRVVAHGREGGEGIGTEWWKGVAVGMRTWSAGMGVGRVVGGLGEARSLAGGRTTIVHFRSICSFAGGKECCDVRSNFWGLTKSPNEPEHIEKRR